MVVWWNDARRCLRGIRLRFILEFRAVIRQKYLGSAKSQDHPLFKLFQDGLSICFANGYALHPASKEVLEYEYVFVTELTSHERAGYISCNYLPRPADHSLSHQACRRSLLCLRLLADLALFYVSAHRVIHFRPVVQSGRSLVCFLSALVPDGRIIVRLALYFTTMLLWHDEFPCLIVCDRRFYYLVCEKVE